MPVITVSAALGGPGFPLTRLRRLRQRDFVRRLVRDSRLAPCDLIQPIFVHAGKQRQAVASMPGVERLGLQDMVALAKYCWTLGIPAVALFPVVPAALKSSTAEQAYCADGLIPQAVQRLKSAVPEIGVITDVALDPYTSHGQDGLLDEKGDVDNDATIDVLVKQSLAHAAAGADVVAPSDMMDGRVLAIRQALEQAGYHAVAILSYAVKYASCFYGPFREAVGSAVNLAGADKKSYQMDVGNRREALREAALDIAEGADMVMVKPALPYLDIVAALRQRCEVPLFAYQVSGEYAMIKAAAAAGFLDERAAVMESLLAIRRSGADAIISYFAADAARWLNASG